MKLKFKYKHSRGFSLLEFAVSFLVSIPVLIVTVDLTKVFQAKSTAKAAVQTALRCLTVTDDPSCSDVKVAASKPLYNVRLLTAQQEEVPLVTYDGEVHYMEGPSYSVGPFKALVLDQGFAEVSGLVDIQGIADLFGVEANVQYNSIGTEVVPQILASSISAREPDMQSGFNEIFIPPASRSANSQLAASSGSVGTLTPYSQASFSGEFTIPSLYSEQTCIGNNAYPGSNRRGDFDCSATSNTGEKYVRGIVVVKGSGRGSGDKVCGVAELKLELLEGNKWILAKDLTGQSFQGDAGNFIPRGYNNSANEELLVNGVIPRFYSPGLTSETFNGEIRFKPGYKYRFVVRTQVDTTLSNSNKSLAKCETGSVNYRIAGGKVYLPKIETITKRVSCAETSDRCQQPTKCSEPQNPQVLEKRLPDSIFSQIVIAEQIRIGDKNGQSIVKDCNIPALTPSEFALINTASLALQSSQCNCSNYKLQAVTSNATRTFGPIDCPKNNRGVSDGQVEGFKLTNSLQAESICPITTPFENSGSGIHKYWQLKEKILYSHESFQPKNCSELNADSIIQNAWNQNFSDYLFPIFEEVSYNLNSEKSRLQLGQESQNFPYYDPKDPFEIAKIDSNYSCGVFTPIAIQIGSLKKNPAQPNSANIFESSEPLVNCLGGHDPNVWKIMLAKNLRRYYSDTENAFFVPKYNRSGKVISNTCGSTVSSDAYGESGNSCSAFSLQSSAKSEVIATNVECNNLPSACATTCSSCQCELSKFTENSNAKVDLKEERAIAKGREELKAFSPWLSRDCGESDCAKLAIESNQERAIGSATIKIPLFSKSFANSFFGDNIFDGKDYFELKYSSERRFERSFVNRP